MTAPYQLFDALDPAIEAALRASIDRWGVIVPVLTDQHGTIIDGHHRARIAKELGVPYRELARHVADDDEARAVALTLNADRRHLEPEQRRELVADLRAQGHSLRAIAGAVGASKSQVERDVDELSRAGQLEQPDRVHGRDGKERPSTRPAPAPVDEADDPEPLFVEGEPGAPVDELQDDVPGEEEPDPVDDDDADEAPQMAGVDAPDDDAGGAVEELDSDALAQAVCRALAGYVAAGGLLPPEISDPFQRWMLDWEPATLEEELLIADAVAAGETVTVKRASLNWTPARRRGLEVLAGCAPAKARIGMGMWSYDGEPILSPAAADWLSGNGFATQPGPDKRLQITQAGRAAWAELYAGGES